MNLLAFQTSADAADAAFTGAVSFDAADPLFAGHFPDTPILPGVAFIDATVALASRALGKRLRLSAVKSVKFTRPLPPGTEAAFAFRVIPAHDAFTVKGGWTLASGGKLAELICTVRNER